LIFAKKLRRSEAMNELHRMFTKRLRLQLHLQ